MTRTERPSGPPAPYAVVPSPSSGRHVVKLKRELQPQAPYFAEAHAARCWAVFKFGFEQGTMVHALPSGKVSVADVAE